VGVKGAAKAGGEQAAFALVRWIAGKTDGKVAADLSDNVLRDAFRSRKTGGSSALRDAERVACALCFPAGTLVTTAHGEQAIQTLHVGDLVQSEDPKTGKVEAEAVQAVIQDPVSPLIAVDLSDGSAITVTADHPFWVDAGAQLAGAGWFAAGNLRTGDELRTAAGAHVMVVGLRRNVGYAVVYTLTVARDHTFFVGSARVLVHNCDPRFANALADAIKRYANVSTNDITKLNVGEVPKLRKLFGVLDYTGTPVQRAEEALKNFSLPEGGIDKEVLLRYAVQAQRAIDAGNDVSGLQAARLKIIERALQELGY